MPGLPSFLAGTRYKDVDHGFDSLLLVCGLATRNARDPALFAWLRKIALAVRRLGSVCVGSFLLVEAGLLDGKRATSHWRFAKEMARRYPKVKVESEPVWIKDESIYTSAGISAGIDLALAWVEEDSAAPPTRSAHQDALQLGHCFQGSGAVTIAAYLLV